MPSATALQNAAAAATARIEQLVADYPAARLIIDAPLNHAGQVRACLRLSPEESETGWGPDPVSARQDLLRRLESRLTAKLQSAA